MPTRLERLRGRLDGERLDAFLLGTPDERVRDVYHGVLRTVPRAEEVVRAGVADHEGDPERLRPGPIPEAR